MNEFILRDNAQKFHILYLSSLILFNEKSALLLWVSKFTNCVKRWEVIIYFFFFLFEKSTSHGVYHDLRTHSWGYAPEMAMLALDRARTRRANTFSIPLFGIRLTRAISFRQLDNSIANSSVPLTPLQFSIYEDCVMRIGNRGCLFEFWTEFTRNRLSDQSDR